MQRLTDTEVRERRSARWARSWVSPRPLGATERDTSSNPRPRDDVIERLVAEDVYGLCPGWWIPVLLIVGIAWMGVIAFAAIKWGF